MTLLYGTNHISDNGADSQLKQLTLQHAPYVPEGQWTDNVAESTNTTAIDAAHSAVDTASDPTIANAGLTELNAQQPVTPAQNAGDSGLPTQLSAGETGANIAAGRSWDSTGPGAGVDGSEESFEMVPRDLAETDTPHAPAGVMPVNSWADDSAEAAANAAAAAVPADANDGFREVQGRRGGHRNNRGEGEGRGRGRGRGGFRGGERGRGGFRGDRRGGSGGEHRGRGRGQPRPS